MERKLKSMYSKTDSEIDIEDLYFGIAAWSFNKNELVFGNLFGYGVKLSIASYLSNRDKYPDLYTNPLIMCFGDTWGRCEWEFMVDGLIESRSNPQKVDVYTVFVKPNADYLMSLVNRVSMKSAKRFLKEHREKYKTHKG